MLMQNVILKPVVSVILYSPLNWAKPNITCEANITGVANITRRKANIAAKRALLTQCSFCWWGKVDSNHRSRRQQIYSLPPLATREFPHIQFAFEKVGAGRRTRTPDLLITNQLLYQPSYTSTFSA